MSRVTPAEAGAADRPAAIARPNLSIRFAAMAPSLPAILGDAVRNGLGCNPLRFPSLVFYRDDGGGSRSGVGASLDRGRAKLLTRTGLD